MNVVEDTKPVPEGPLDDPYRSMEEKVIVKTHVTFTINEVCEALRKYVLEKQPRVDMGKKFTLQWLGKPSTGPWINLIESTSCDEEVRP